MSAILSGEIVSVYKRKAFCLPLFALLYAISACSASRSSSLKFIVIRSVSTCGWNVKWIIIGLPAVWEYFSVFSKTRIMRINTRSSSGVSFSISTYALACSMNSRMHTSRIFFLVMDASSCINSAYSVSIPQP